MSYTSGSACDVSEDNNSGSKQENSAQKAVSKKMPFEEKPKPGKESKKHSNF